jgi:hypothetical protein
VPDADTVLAEDLSAVVGPLRRHARRIDAVAAARCIWDGRRVLQVSG